MPLASSFLALLAGGLSILSPCVLPLLPLVLGTAVSEHRVGPVALAAGLALSFVAVGLFVATIGFSIGRDASVFRDLAAALILAAGLVLLVPRLQMQVAIAGGRISNWAGQRFGRVGGSGLGGQFAVGLLLGAVWSPCVGPTLGAASILAAQGKDLGHVAFIMAMFGIGAALPLMLLGFLSRQALMGMRDRLMQAGKAGKIALGAVLATLGVLILIGLDKSLETLLVAASPGWLTQLTTRL